MVAVMYRAGLRVSEMLALKASDINADAGTIRVLHGKGNRARVMGIDQGTLAMVQVWIAARHRLGLSRAVSVLHPAAASRSPTCISAP